jgi:hypothetical protein
MKLPFHTLDVFTDRTFGGNQLGIFPDAAHLPTALMQRIAGEMNIAETVFLGPATDAGAAARRPRARRRALRRRAAAFRALHDRRAAGAPPRTSRAP